jgi:hypothetical protein
VCKAELQIKIPCARGESRLALLTVGKGHSALTDVETSAEDLTQRGARDDTPHRVSTEVEPGRPLPLIRAQ